MWLLNRFPVDEVAKRHRFKATPEFLKSLQLSAARFNNGGTASFVSANGLLLTNHHVGADCIQKVSSSEADYMKHGFLATSRTDEKRCPDLEVNVLLEIEDVTAKVTEGISGDTPDAEANRLRKAKMSEIEKSCADSTGRRCDVVTLFSGAQFHLYQYKRYTDVRLVFAPEFDAAFFGGDPENFTYPRHCLDAAFFRAYEDGVPAKVEHWFKWSKTGVRDGELVFVPGNPGATGRLMTVAELEFTGEIAYPLVLRRLKSMIDALETYISQGEEQRRVGSENLFGQQNSFKAISGFQRGLQSKSLMDQKRKEENQLRRSIARDRQLRARTEKLWDELASAYGNLREFYPRYYMFESGATRGSALMGLARGIVRYAGETTKPNEERLREYVETALPAREQAMYSPAPMTPSMEMAVLADYFTFLGRELGYSDPVVAALLNGRTPLAAARHAVENTKIINVEERRRLANDPAAVASSSDGMIRLARALDGPARELRKRYEDELESVEARAKTEIAQARFAVSGGSAYPDATFTLRVAFGPVKGYRNAQGRRIPWATDLGGKFQKGRAEEPYRIPESWLKAKDQLRLSTPYNFVSTADTHGGNSGSATVNTQGEVVGILFDGNIEGLPNRFVYADRMARSVHVASQAIIETLRKVYKAEQLLTELGF
ncbi:MAG: S46 family peptidase [Bryobacteraceae bacterium]|nr:S46 family peptidase [Bryobacteraceae bacterium]